jgi:hypothetical protein
VSVNNTRSRNTNLAIVNDRSAISLITVLYTLWLFRQEGKHCVRRFVSLLSCSGTKKNCLTSGKSQLYLFTERVILTIVIIEAYDCCQLNTKFYQRFFSLRECYMQMKLLGLTNVDFGVIDIRLNRFFIFGRYLRKMGV